jgi:hypothetical protein
MLICDTDSREDCKLQYTKAGCIHSKVHERDATCHTGSKVDTTNKDYYQCICIGVDKAKQKGQL